MVHGEVALRFALIHFSTSAGLPSNGLSRFGRVVSVAIGLMTASSRRLECVHFLQAATRFRPLRQLFHFANVATLPLVGQKLALVHKSEETALMSACVIAAQLVMLPVALLVDVEVDAGYLAIPFKFAVPPTIGSRRANPPCALPLQGRRSRGPSPSVWS